MYNNMIIHIDLIYIMRGCVYFMPLALVFGTGNVVDSIIHREREREGYDCF